MLSRSKGPSQKQQHPKAMHRPTHNDAPPTNVPLVNDEPWVAQLKEKVAELEKSFLTVKNENRLLSERLHETRLLYRIAAMLNSTYDLAKLFHIIGTMLSEISFINQFALIEKNPDGSFEVHLTTEKDKQSNMKFMLDIERDLAEHVLVSKQKEEFVPQLSERKEFLKYLTEKGGGSVLVVAIPSQKKSQRVLCFHSVEEMPENQKDFLRLIANEAAISIERTQIYHDTLEISIKDELTKIYNRRYFNDRVQREFARAERYTHKISFIMIDIDHFKKFNDTYGHHIGDEVLKWVAGSLSLGIRECDILARYGGEEFIIILPETDKNGAAFVAEKVRKYIADNSVAFGKTLNLEISITISLGVASYPSNGKNVADLLEKADQHLYVAKSNGRNQVCWKKD
jgi:diguanylate cyclase (GGDEF)-like protein